MPFEQLKQRQREMWGSGPYEAVVGITSEVHETLVEALEPLARRAAPRRRRRAPVPWRSVPPRAARPSPGWISLPYWCRPRGRRPRQPVSRRRSSTATRKRCPSRTPPSTSPARRSARSSHPTTRPWLEKLRPRHQARRPPRARVLEHPERRRGDVRGDAAVHAAGAGGRRQHLRLGPPGARGVAPRRRLRAAHEHAGDGHPRCVGRGAVGAFRRRLRPDEDARRVTRARAARRGSSVETSSRSSRGIGTGTRSCRRARTC